VWADDTYEKVTSSSQVSVGSQIIFVCEGNNQAMQNDANYSGTDVTIEDSKITLGTSSTVCVMTVGGEADAYTFAVSEDNLLSWKKNGFQINFSTGNGDKWTIASDGSFTCNVSGVTDSSTRKQVRHNVSGTTNKFGCYTSSTGKAVCIYVKKVAKKDPTITFNNGSVRVGKTLDLSTLFTSNSTGDVTYSITAGDSYASITGSTLTGVAEGSVTVQASQAAAGSFNAKAVTATITVNAALTLSSIAITTAPTTLIYTEGETFDATDMVVTATYSDASTDDVTALCTWTPSGALTTADVEITVSYTENGTTKTATQAITVNPYVQPTTVTIQMTNDLFGEEVHTSGKSTSELTFVGTQDNVTVTYYVPNDSYYYFNTSNTRPYNTCTLDYAAPSGFVITEIVFTADGSNWKDATPSTGSMTDTKQWEGAASNVTFSWAESGARIKTVVVTLAQVTPVTITGAEYATYCNATKALDFSATGITVYTAEDKETSVGLNEVASGKIPANTPVVLYKAGGGVDINVPIIASADAPAGTNDLHVSTGTDVANMYVLSKLGGKVGFYPWGGTNLSAGKIYLQGKASYGAREFIGFGDATGIDSVTRDALKNDKIYNLQGQEVKNATKGIFIVNGKKVFLK